MVLLVDDILKLPSTIGSIIFNTLTQTINKVAWAEYSRNLKKTLLRARHDYDNKKISKEQFQKTESKVFKEMRLANKIMQSKQ